METLDIEIQGRPGPERSELEARVERLGYRIRRPAHGTPTPQLVLIDARHGGVELGADRRPTVLLVGEATEHSASLAKSAEHVILAVDPAGSEATLRVALPLCAMIHVTPAALV